ncbi:MAG: hypothetical protein QM504_06825 [Pseudomonadota bacterium]
MPKNISEVRSGHVDDDNYCHIDVYCGNLLDDEPGKTVAIVCLDTKKVFYIDNGYIGIPIVQEEIDNVLAGLVKDDGSNTVEWIHVAYLARANRTIESCKIQRNGFDTEYGYVYNYEGVHYRYFPNMLGLLAFFEIDEHPQADFGEESSLDQYLQKKILCNSNTKGDGAYDANQLLIGEIHAKEDGG